MKKNGYFVNLPRKIYVAGAKSKWVKAAVVLFCAFVVTFCVAREVFFTNNDTTLTFGDNPLFTLKSGPIISEYVTQGWNRAVYGDNQPAPFAYLFLYLFDQLAFYAQNIQVFNLLLNLSFPLSFLAFYFFSAKFCKSFWLRIFASAFYLVNPIIITYYGVGGFMWSLVFLPLSLSFFIDLLEKRTNRNLAKTAIFTSLTMWAFPNLTVILILTLGAVALSYLITATSKLGFLKTAFPRLFILLLAILALNASFLYAQYTYNQSSSYGYNPVSVLRDFQYTYSSMSIDNLLMLSGNVASPQTTLGYVNSLNITNEVGIIIPIISLMSIFWIIKNREHKNAIIAMLVSVAFISVLTLLIRAVVYHQSWIITSPYLSVLWTLRNPLKLQVMLTVCIIPLFIYSLEKITVSARHYLRQKNRLYAILTLSLVILGASQIYIYNSFAFNGYAGLDIDYSASSYSPNPTLLRIVNDSMQWYGDGEFRGIILPFDHTTELHVQFTNPLLYPTKLGLESNITNKLSDAIDTGSNVKFLLSLLGTKYVYVNNAWTNTGFQIIQANPPELIKNLNADNLHEDNFGDYSKFTVSTALPHLYLSNYPIYFSSIETVGKLNSTDLLNDETFQYNPVFYEIKEVTQQPTVSSQLPNMVFSSYEWEMLQQGTYNIYPVIYSNNETEISTHYTLDSQPVTYKNMSAVSHLDQRYLETGNHNLSLAIGNAIPFQNLITDSTNNYDGATPIINKTDFTFDEYGAFDLHLQFKPISWGQADWNGPQIYFNYMNESSYVRLIFHKSGLLELAECIPRGNDTPDYRQGVVTRAYVLNSGDALNDLRVVKYDDTLTVYLNGENLFTFSDGAIGQSGKIGVGSESSTTNFENVNINEEIVAGVWLIPAEKKNETPFTLLESNSAKYRIEFNQTDTPPILYLGENFDLGWTATIDGTPLSYHAKANLYANSWATNTTSGTHIIEINYKPNTTYQTLVYADIVGIFVLAIASFAPIKILRKISLRRKK